MDTFLSHLSPFLLYAIPLCVFVGIIMRAVTERVVSGENAFVLLILTVAWPVSYPFMLIVWTVYVLSSRLIKKFSK